MRDALGFELGGGGKSFSSLPPPFRHFFSTLSLLPPPDAHLFPPLKLPKDPFHVLYIYVGRGRRRGQSKDEGEGGLVGGRSDPMCVYPHAFLPLSPSRKMGGRSTFWAPSPTFLSSPLLRKGSPPPLRSSSVSSRGFLESQRRKEGEGGREGKGQTALSHATLGRRRRRRPDLRGAEEPYRRSLFAMAAQPVASPRFVAVLLYFISRKRR